MAPGSVICVFGRHERVQNFHKHYIAKSGTTNLPTDQGTFRYPATTGCATPRRTGQYGIKFHLVNLEHLFRYTSHYIINSCMLGPSLLMALFNF